MAHAQKNSNALSTFCPQHLVKKYVFSLRLKVWRLSRNSFFWGDR